MFVALEPDGTVDGDVQDLAVLLALAASAQPGQAATFSVKRGLFSWSVWNYGGAFGIVDAFDGDRAEPNVLDVIKSLP